MIENLQDATTFNVHEKLITWLSEERMRGIGITPSLGQAFLFCHCMGWGIVGKTVGNIYHVIVEWYDPYHICHEIGTRNDNPADAAWLAIIGALESGAKHV